jgi:AsmA protein
MRRPPLFRIALKFVKFSGIAMAVLLLLMFILPYLFPGFIAGKIRQWAKTSIRSELKFSTARLSFFSHFPALSLTLYDFSLKGAEPFGNDALVEADEVALGLDLRTALSSEVRIDKIFLTNAFINIQVDTAGHANYDIYISKKNNSPSTPSDSGSASLKIRKILIEKSNLVYNDRSLPMLINARDLYYKGNGDLSDAIFDLNSHTEIGSMDFYYNRQAWFVSKKINADLVTRINTNSLALYFQRNNLIINQLPVAFTGRFEFLKNGYDMDFNLRSTDPDLHDIFTAMPPTTLDWLEKTEVKGFGDIEASLKGQYIASTGKMPDLTLNMKIRNGFVANAHASSPVQNLYLDFHSRLPGLNPDSMSVRIDSLYFNIDKDYFSTVMGWNGFRQPFVSARINSEMDLEKFDQAFRLTPYRLKGRIDLHVQAEGNYGTRLVRNNSFRKTRPDTIITSIPSFEVSSSLSNGYFKYESSPEAIRNINFKLDASCPDHDYRHAGLSVENVNANILSNTIKGFLKLGNTHGLHINAGLESVLHLPDIQKAYPMDSMQLAGDLNVHVYTNGIYQPSKHLFPVTVANLQLNNGFLQTKYYPHPLEKIQVSAKVTSHSGSLKDLDINLTPLSFLFEDQPFTVKADLQNFENLKYHIVSHGTLDIGRIARVFALPDYDLKGLVETNLSLKGRQSDAVAGRYDQLVNSGTMKVKDLQISSELFPQPFLIRTGLFRFDHDKMWFDKFNASYGKTNLTLNGWLSNVIGYMTNKHSPLKGNFDLNSNFILADEFMAFASPAGKSSQGDPSPRQPGLSRQSVTAGGVPPSYASFASNKFPNPDGTPKADRTPGPGPTPVPEPGRATLRAPDKEQTIDPEPAAGQTGVIIVPDNLSISFHAMVRRVRYQGIDLEDCKGQLTLDSGKLSLNKTVFTLIGAPVEMDAHYQSLSPQKAQFDYHISAKEFDVKKAYKEIKLFHDMASSASKAEGIISLDYQLAGKLDGNMRPDYPSLKGGGSLSVKKVKVKGLKLFGAVSKESGKDVNDPDLSKVEIRSTINNNLITIPRTRMKVSVFKLRMEGQASFDGKLNLRFRVGLPPFGVIGIPLKITGTQENPKVKAGKGSDKDELEETEDKDDPAPVTQ